jgi:SAM-dependent methyltransferase
MTTDQFGDPQWVKNYEFHVGNQVLIPYLIKAGINIKEKKILDLGCGSGGILWSFVDGGARGTGIDRNVDRIQEASQHLSFKPGQPRPNFIVGDILKPLSFPGCYDLVLLIEVVEHLLNQDYICQTLSVASKSLCDHNGKIFLTFPPFKSPFGGHQAGWRNISFIPWIHLWPRFLLRKVVDPKYLDLIDGELNHISVEKFEECVKKAGLRIVKSAFFFIRPEYFIRYRVKPIQFPVFLSSLGIVREYFTSGAYYLLERRS